ncbi:MAG: hypothetical protein U0625_13575 [Phycisphaerales bacterium]
MHASTLLSRSHSHDSGRTACVSGCALAAVLAALAPAAIAGAELIDFEDLPHTGGAIVPVAGDHYAAQGLHISSCTVPGTPMLDDVFTITDILNEFAYVSNNNSVSGSNFAGARDLGLQDTLFSFSSPITSLSMISDSAPDGPTFRLLALQATGDPNTFRVVAIDEAVTGYQDHLDVSFAGGFSFAIFQVTTEQEGFDDISYTFVPGPGALAAFAAAGLARSRRRK